MPELLISLIELLLDRLVNDKDEWVPANNILLSGKETSFCYNLIGKKTIIEIYKNTDGSANFSVYSNEDGTFKEIVSIKGSKEGLAIKLYEEISMKDKNKVKYMEDLITALGGYIG